jgi:hypothetical protein
MDTPNRLPDAIQKVLASADRSELLSLDPKGGQTREAGHFWGWRVLAPWWSRPRNATSACAPHQTGMRRLA